MKNYKKQIRILTIAVCVLFVLTAGVGLAVYSRAKHVAGNPLDVLGSGASPAPISGQSIANTTDPYIYNESIINLVLMGIDSDSARLSNGIEQYQADTLLICAIDTQNHSVKAITVPRDTQAEMQLLDSQGNIVRIVTGKINNAINNAQAGLSDLGFQNMLSSLENLFQNANISIDLQHYVGIDMDGIAPIANAVGGVPVTLTDTIAGVGKKGESVLLKGDIAKKYIRTRKGEGLSGSDVDRANRQRLYFKSLASRIKALGVGAIPSLYGNVSKYIHTNLNVEQMIALANTLAKVDIERIEFHTIEGEYQVIEGSDVYVADMEALEQLALDTWFLENPNYQPSTTD